jgi:hypothetical protein
MQDDHNAPIADRPPVPPTVALRAEQEVVLGAVEQDYVGGVHPLAGAAARVSARWQAKRWGVCCLVIAAVLGILAVPLLRASQPAGGALVLWSLAHCIVGAWLLAAPSAAGAYAAAAVALAGVSGIVAVPALDGKYAIALFPAIIGVGWCLAARWYGAAMLQPADAEAESRVRSAVGELRPRTCLSRSDVIMIADRPPGSSHFRVLLQAEGAILVNFGGASVRVAMRDGFVIDTIGRRSGGRHNVLLTNGDPWTIFGELAVIQDDHLIRYQAWQAGTMPEEVRAAIKGPNP